MSSIDLKVLADSLETHAHQIRSIAETLREVEKEPRIETSAVGWRQLPVWRIVFADASWPSVAK